ncbi:MAG: hypothetical protein H0U59_03790 [Gemmatimonadaceae bacterium]|nr:hypothetical protein [Gemmatimonadaceae bacterium]
MNLLPAHIIGGLIAIVAGFVAIYALKGGRLHRGSGKIFVYSMLVLALTGAVLGVLKSQRLNAAQGVLTFYLVTTAFLTVRRRSDGFPWIDAGAMLVAFTVGLYEVTLGFEALNSPRGTMDGVPAGAAFTFATVALLAALGDVRMMMVRGLQGAQRIARHLWRMCFALFVATGSFFLGQSQVFPKPIRIVPLLAVPALLPLVLMLYWLVRVLFTKWYRRRANDSLKPTPVRASA